MPPGTPWFKPREGCFWVERPVLTVNRPPFHPEQRIIMSWEQAPIPATAEEALTSIRVMEALPAGALWWPGQWLNEVPGMDWSQEDREHWERWLRDEPRLPEFLDAAVQRCQEQAKWLQDPANRQQSVSVEWPVAQLDPGLETRIQALKQRLCDAEGRIERAADAGAGPSEVSALEAELNDMLAEAEDLRDQAMDSHVAWQNVGLALRLFGEHREAERMFREALRLNPRSLSAWLELTICLDELGDREAQLQAAKWATRMAAEDNPAPWRNLAMTHIRRGEREDAVRAIQEALRRNPEDRSAIELHATLDQLLTGNGKGGDVRPWVVWDQDGSVARGLRLDAVPAKPPTRRSGETTLVGVVEWSFPYTDGRTRWMVSRHGRRGMWVLWHDDVKDSSGRALAKLAIAACFWPRANPEDAARWLMRRYLECCRDNVVSWTGYDFILEDGVFDLHQLVEEVFDSTGKE